jgi:hypothetical protein
MCFKVPVLFQFYNRLDTSIKVFEEIRKQKPLYVYLVQDGLKSGDAEGNNEYARVREVILGMIDWDCNLKTLFRDQNLGPGAGTADGIKWFFRNEEYGIFLEHDCLPHPDFFEYCSVLLELYKTDTRVKIISGSNYQLYKKFGRYSYYFGVTGQLWGWAGWRRSFENYISDISEIDHELFRQNTSSTFKSDGVREYWTNTYNWILNGIVDTWDYQLMYTIWREKGVIIFPNVNLISNIGFGDRSLHCKDMNSIMACSKTANILPLKHPWIVKRSVESDIHYYDHYLSQESIVKINFIKRLKRKIKIILPSFIYNIFREKG